VSNPPSTTSPPRAARRALMTSVAALSAIAAPVALVAATVGNGSSSTAAEKPALVSETRDIQTANASLATRFVDGTSAVVAFNASAADAQLARIQRIVAPTTTVPAPTPTTTAPPAPKVAAAAPVAVAAKAGADPNDPATWDRLAQCEAGGNWATNTGNGYYGGLQFSASTWRSVGGTGLPHQHSRETQIEMGKRLQARAGWGQWPACTRRLGYR